MGVPPFRNKHFQILNAASGIVFCQDDLYFPITRMLAPASVLKNPESPESITPSSFTEAFLLISWNHPPPPGKKKGIQQSGCFTKNLYFILFGSAWPFGQPLLCYGAPFCPFGPSPGLLGSLILHLRTSSGAPFCILGHLRASSGILGPGRTLQGNFLFHSNQSSNHLHCRMRFPPQENYQTYNVLYF